MKPIHLRRRIAGLVSACLLGACAGPDVSVTATDYGEEGTAFYLVLSDQLQRVRNVLKRPAAVCVTVELSDGMAPVPPDILERLAREQASNEIPLSVVSTYECLVHYMHDKGPFTPERTDILVLARHESYGSCGEWLGGMYNQGNLDRGVYYNVEVQAGVARLTGGRACASHLRWYRT